MFIIFIKDYNILILFFLIKKTKYNLNQIYLYNYNIKIKIEKLK